MSIFFYEMISDIYFTCHILYFIYVCVYIFARALCVTYVC